MILFSKPKNEFCLFNSNIPFYYNNDTKTVITHGLEVENVLTHPIPRKTDSTNLVLDSYEFIPNNDLNAIEEYDKKHINEYLEVKVFLKSIIYIELIYY